MQLSLYERPEIFDCVRVNFSAHVFDSMVNYFMLISVIESDVGLERIGVERRASFHMLFNQWLQIALAALRYDLRANFPATLHESDYDRFIFVKNTRSSSAALFVHVPSLAADERFIYLYLASLAPKLRCVERVLQGEAQTLEHEPRGL